MPIAVRIFRPADYDRVVALRNAAHPTRPVSLASFMDEDARQCGDPTSVWVRFVAADQDKGLVGYGDAGHYLGMPPGRFLVFVTVSREFRGRGIGSALPLPGTSIGCVREA